MLRFLRKEDVHISKQGALVSLCEGCYRWIGELYVDVACCSRVISAVRVVVLIKRDMYCRVISRVVGVALW